MASPLVALNHTTSARIPLLRHGDHAAGVRY
jgi:hypothetical protein